MLDRLRTTHEQAMLEKINELVDDRNDTQNSTLPQADISTLSYNASNRDVIAKLNEIIAYLQGEL